MIARPCCVSCVLNLGDRCTPLGFWTCWMQVPAPSPRSYQDSYMAMSADYSQFRPHHLPRPRRRITRFQENSR